MDLVTDETVSRKKERRATWAWKTLSLVCWLVCVYLGWRWSRTIPPVGYAIGVLGAASAAMAAFLDRLEWLGKVGWILLMFALLIVETRAITKADNDLKDQFATVLSQAQTNLKTTLDSQDAQFNATMDRLRLVINSQKSIASIQADARDDARLEGLEIQALRDQVEAPSASVRAAVISSEPVQRTAEETKQLKLKALQLAKDINDWIASVAQYKPREPHPTDAEDAAYENKLQEFDTRFGREANQMVHDLQVEHMLVACAPLQGTSDVILTLRQSCAANIERAALNLD